MLGDTSYITIGDEYDKTKELTPDRCKGVQMKVGGQKRGNGPDALFDTQFKSLSEGDKYIDPGQLEKRERIESRKRLITTDGFKFSSPAGKGGGLNGCFTKEYKHETEFVLPKRGEITKALAPGPRNMVTSPPKKGTYGTMGTTLGGGDEYKYISDPYDTHTKAKETKKQSIGPAFKSCGRTGDYFDSQPNVSASKVYSLDQPLPAKKPAGNSVKAPITTPFRPSNPAKKGYNQGMGNFEYREDPYELREKKARDERMKNKPTVVWKPTGGSKTLPTRSVAFHATAAD